MCQENPSKFSLALSPSFRVHLWNFSGKSNCTRLKAQGEKGPSLVTSLSHCCWLILSFFCRVPKGRVLKGGGNWGTLRIPMEDFGRFLTQPSWTLKKKPFERLDIFPTKYVIPKSLKFSHWPSKFLFVENYPKPVTKRWLYLE